MKKTTVLAAGLVLLVACGGPSALYYRGVKPLNENELSMWLVKYQYFPTVFVLPPWKAIYVNDAERDHSFEHAESVNRIAQEWYRRCGYQLLEVPRVSVDERCTFVLEALANGA